MKKTVIFFTLLFTLIALLCIGCSSGIDGQSKAEPTDKAILANLLKGARMKSAEISIEYEWVVPDSLKDKLANFVTATVGAATNNLKTDDYEDTDDLVEETGKVGNNIYAVRTKRVYLSFVPIGKGDYQKEAILVEDLAPSQKAVFDFLNK